MSTTRGPSARSIFSFGTANLPKKVEEPRKGSNTTTTSIALDKTNQDELQVSSQQPLMNGSPTKRKKFALRQDSVGYSPEEHHTSTKHVKIDSLQYLDDESEAYRAFNAANHFHYRGTFWNEGKREIMVRYFQLVMIGIFQGSIAYVTNVFSHAFIEVRKISLMTLYTFIFISHLIT
jgi:hypothetical protein